MLWWVILWATFVPTLGAPMPQEGTLEMVPEHSENPCTNGSFEQVGPGGFAADWGAGRTLGPDDPPGPHRPVGSGAYPHGPDSPAGGDRPEPLQADRPSPGRHGVLVPGTLGRRSTTSDHGHSRRAGWPGTNRVGQNGIPGTSPSCGRRPVAQSPSPV